MVLLRDEAQVEARFGMLGDSANLDADRCMVCVTEPPNLYKIKYGCPANVLTRAYFHLYKPGSLPSVLKDLGKSTSQPRSRD